LDEVTRSLNSPFKKSGCHREPKAEFSRNREPNEIVRFSISIALKRLSQSFHFQTSAKQREQAPYEYDSTDSQQEHIEIRLQSGNMPEDDDSKQRTAENETKASEKQKYMIEE
jgi:hypothetical protein